MGNPVTWFEINGPAPEEAAAFYSAVFGWRTQTVTGGYIITETGAGAGINGGFGGTEPGPAGAVFYVQGPDIQALLDRSNGLGAETVVPVTEVPQMVTFAQFRDPWGNVVGLLQGSEDEVPSISEGQNPPVDWFEMNCAEPAQAWDFYRELFGWEIETQHDKDAVHGGVKTGWFAAESPPKPGGMLRGGIGSTPDSRARVVLYATVDDVQAYLDRAGVNGGSTVMPPTQVDPVTTIGIFADPQGTLFGVYRSAG